MVDFPDPFDKVGSALVRTGDYDPTITFGADGLADPALPELAGDEVTEGMRATVAGSIEGGPGEAFAQLYEEAGGVGRGPYDGQNFDNVILCYLAAVAAGSTEGEEMAAALPDVTNAPGDQYTWEELPEAVEALQNGDDIDYQGVTGDVELDDAGDPTSGVFGVFEYAEGEFTPVDTFDYGGREVAPRSNRRRGYFARLIGGNGREHRALGRFSFSLSRAGRASIRASRRRDTARPPSGQRAARARHPRSGSRRGRAHNRGRTSPAPAGRSARPSGS